MFFLYSWEDCLPLSLMSILPSNWKLSWFLHLSCFLLSVQHSLLHFPDSYPPFTLDLFIFSDLPSYFTAPPPPHHLGYLDNHIQLNYANPGIVSSLQKHVPCFGPMSSDFLKTTTTTTAHRGQLQSHGLNFQNIVYNCDGFGLIWH